MIIVKHLLPHEYLLMKLITGIWTCNNKTINFTLIVDNFGVKYKSKTDMVHIQRKTKREYTMNKF